MIQRLYIKDYALIDELDVSFQFGLNILTGETGAGKSIIIGALNMILGERADTEVIRQGAQKAISEAEFSIGSDVRIAELLEKQDIDTGEQLILRREIRTSGSRAFINDTPVNISVLKQTGDLLVDLHGQHDHQLLLREEHHRRVIDGFSSIREAMEAYRSSYQAAQESHQTLQELRRKEQELKEQTERYRYEFEELEAAELDKEEPERIEAELKKLDNAEELDRKAALIAHLGTESESNVADQLHHIRQALEELSQIDSEFESYAEEVRQAAVSIQEMLSFTERYRNNIEFNPERLEYLRQRKAELNRLQKKYQRSIPELLSYQQELHEQLNLAENFDLEVEKREQQLQQQLQDLKEKAVYLHDRRRSEADQLEKRIEGQLQNLGMPHARFHIQVEWLWQQDGWIEVEGQQVQCTEHGPDLVRFNISPNKGEEVKPLSKTASGGEISRIMLALKSVVASEQQLPVMIFDEIDTGIGGAVAERVGMTMRSLSASCQIIAITHQPQIASQAHHHYRVEKREQQDRTITRLQPLDGENHIREIASLISGAEISDHAVESARQMVEKAERNTAPANEQQS